MPKVLIADDSPFMREVLMKILKSHDINDFVEAENGKYAVDKYEIENCKRVIEGDVVVVEKGPFTGLIATCEKKSGNHRVVVKIDSLQSCVVVNVPLSYLRKIENKVLV